MRWVRRAFLPGEAGSVLGLPERTAKRHWANVRAWLFDALQRGENRGRE
ncbi:MAG: hypothetical protein ACKV19_28390 [Verrucomicrobiales bacterium]